MLRRGGRALRRRRVRRAGPRPPPVARPPARLVHPRRRRRARAPVRPPDAEFDLHLTVGDRSGILLAFLIGGAGRGSGRRARAYSTTAGCASPTSALSGRADQRDPHRLHRRGRVPRRRPRLLPPGHGQTRTSRSSARRSSTSWRPASGAPGRDQLHARARAADRPRGRLGDARRPAGIGAAFLGHAITRVADLPDHRPRRPAAGPRHRGRGRREAPPDARGLARRRPERRQSDALTPCPRAQRRDGTRRRPSRSTSTSRSASRICPYCDFVVSPVARRAALPTGSERSPRRWRWSSACARTPWTRAGGSAGSRHAARRRADPVPRRRDAEPASRWRRSRRLIELVRGAVRARDGAEVTLEVNPGRTSAATRGAARRRRDAAVDRRPEPRSRGAAGPRPAARGRRTSPRRVRARARSRASSPSASTSCTTCPGQPRRARGRASLDGALRLEPDHVSLYALTLDDPDAEGITGSGGDHLPVRAGRASAGAQRARAGQDDDRAAAMYELADERLARRGLRLVRDQQLGTARATRRGTTSAYWREPFVGGRRAGRARLRRHDPALERRPPRWLPRRARCRGDGSPPAPSARRPRADRGRRGRRRRSRDARRCAPAPAFRARRSMSRRFGRRSTGRSTRGLLERSRRSARPHPPRPAPVERGLRAPGLTRRAGRPFTPR